MKYLALATAALTLSACMESEPTPLIPLDDPRRAELEARHAGTLYGASGIDPFAWVGAHIVDGDGANIKIDSRYSTPAEIAAAPEKVCAFLNGTVASFRNEGNPSGNFDLEAEFVRYLYITCNI